MKTIAIINQKGGVGKSTTSQALAAGLSLKGYKPLLIDLDPQCNTTFTAACSSSPTITGLLLGEVSAPAAIQHTGLGDIIAASKALSGADTMITGTGREYRLKEALEPLQAVYDFAIIDTPPALGILTVNALVAADTVVIPAQADIYSLQGIAALSETLQPVKKYCNADLKIAGILLTRFSPRSILSRDIADQAEQAAGQLQTKVFKATIREAIAVKEAQINQQSIFSYAPKSRVAGDYLQFTEEFLNSLYSTGK